MSLGIEKKAFRSVNPEDFVFCVIFLDQKNKKQLIIKLLSEGM